MSGGSGYPSVYPTLSPSPPYYRPPPFNPEFTGFPAPSAPPLPPSTPTLPSWLPLSLPLLKLSVGVGATCVCLWFAYRAGQRSQQQPPYQPLPQAQRRREEEREADDRGGWGASPASQSISWFDVLPGLAAPGVPAADEPISPAVRRSLRRTAMYILSGLGITGGTIAYLTLIAPRSSSPSAVFAALSSNRTRIAALIATLLSAFAVQLLSKRRVLLKHLAFLLFHVSSGVSLAPLFFLPSSLTLRAAFTTSTILASTVALALSARTRSSLWLYAPAVVGSSILAATGLYDLVGLLIGRTASASDSRLMGRSGLVIVASVLLFSGYVVLDLQKLIAVSDQLERQRRRRAVEVAGLAGAAGPPPDDDDDGPPRRFPFRPPPEAPGYRRPPGDDEDRPGRRRPPPSSGLGAKSEERGRGGAPVREEREEKKEERSWVSSDEYPDHAALALDLYLDAINVFVSVLDWYTRQAQEEEEQQQDAQQQRRRGG